MKPVLSVLIVAIDLASAPLIAGEKIHVEASGDDGIQFTELDGNGKGDEIKTNNVVVK